MLKIEQHFKLSMIQYA